ncbi:hypothetical protein FHG55_00880 [Pseudomonas jessenii]|uniref:Uncharacterized protein n=1 Tax=Pseudomonas jessenii TaxID=77298 RepID=A0A5C4L461_PSEJE|nr:hypothetical protein FHG55_00880 [Pseudomonas jessenii]
MPSHKTLWERACSRMRFIRQHYCCLTHRFREQARSHSLFAYSLNSWLQPWPWRRVDAALRTGTHRWPRTR